MTEHFKAELKTDVILSEAKDRFRAKAVELPWMESGPSSLRSSG